MSSALAWDAMLDVRRVKVVKLLSCQLRAASVRQCLGLSVCLAVSLASRSRGTFTRPRRRHSQLRLHLRLTLPPPPLGELLTQVHVKAEAEAGGAGESTRASLIDNFASQPSISSFPHQQRSPSTWHPHLNPISPATSTSQ